MSESQEIEVERQEALRLAIQNFDFDGATNTVAGNSELIRRFGPGTFGSHEAADRLWIQGENVECYILNHPTVAMNKEAYQKVYEAHQLLLAAYQLIACADPE